MKPLLAHVYQPHRVTYPCYVQPKLNGVRALYQNGHFQSRGLQPFDKALLQHLADELLPWFGPETVLDGELYVHDWPLGRINGAVTPIRKEEKEDTKHIEYHIFDQVDYNKPFKDRITIIPNEITKIKLVQTIRIVSEQESDALYLMWVNQGYEGMMYRVGDCPYTIPKQLKDSPHPWHLPVTKTKFLSDQNNRTWHLLKRKAWQDDEFEIEGYQLTIGEKGEAGFQLFCRTKQGKHFTVGSGLTDPQRDYYHYSPPIGRYAKIKYLVLSADGIPQNPTILTIL